MNIPNKNANIANKIASIKKKINEFKLYRELMISEGGKIDASDREREQALYKELQRLQHMGPKPLAPKKSYATHRSPQ